jgi:outer membrane protein TolC
VLLRNAAESNEELAQLQIQDKFEELWTQRESLHESIGVLKQALESSKLFLKSTRSGYEKGIKNQIDIMEAELKMKSVESELNISHHDMMINEVGLLDLTGRLGVENYQ